MSGVIYDRLSGLWCVRGKSPIRSCHISHFTPKYALALFGQPTLSQDKPCIIVTIYLRKEDLRTKTELWEGFYHLKERVLTFWPDQKHYEIISRSKIQNKVYVSFSLPSYNFTIIISFTRNVKISGIALWEKKRPQHFKMSPFTI